MRLRRQNPLATFLIAGLLIQPVAVSAQIAREAVDLEIVSQIREEGLERSQVESMARHLTEVIGPRLTGSPGMKQANDWTVQMFAEFGLENAVVESWGEFGRGWTNEGYAGRILTPFQQPLHGQPRAWTGSTDGMVRGQAVVAPIQNMEDVARYRGQLANAFILQDNLAEVTPEFEHRDRRTSLESLLTPPPPPGAGRGRRGGGRGRGGANPIQEARAAFVEMAMAEGAAAFLRNSNRGNGVVTGGGAGSRQAGAPEGLPHIALSREQYNQIYRNVTNGVPVEIEMMVENRFYEDDLDQYNSLAEIPGTDKADEFVMLGAHLDSWHMGTGATDNAAGSVIMMEAMRILKAIGVQPRRTIRIALWSGEEQGLIGSNRYLDNHPELHDKISAYVNVDNGTGRLRGIWNQSNAGATPVFEQILWPFRDLGVVAVKHGNTGGTDHLAFDRRGIPGFNFIQDPIEYGVNTHHTELDTFDHLVIEDLQQAAVVVAATVYALAMRDEMMPRKSGPISDS
ncbi:MAG: M20/M25/M40 family metallo-hydrolase [Gemmatimonadota bacterium]|nr:M20/M25/M40 family metallo-hydrolase [Gemmatimonadota bacterium]